MPGGSASALALAARLRALDDDALTRLVRVRDIRDPRLHDLFDLADALLDGASIQSALQPLERPVLAVLAAAAENGGPVTAVELAVRVGVPADAVAERLQLVADLGLVDVHEDGVEAWDAVAERLRAWPAEGLPSLDQLLDVPAPPALDPVAVDDRRITDRGASERAFATVTTVTELILAMRDQPIRELARGGVALPDARRLAAQGIDPADLTALLEIVDRAELAALDRGEWAITADANDWVLMTRPQRWARLASGWIDRLPDDLRALLRERVGVEWGEGLLDYLRWLFPAGGDWMRSRVVDISREAELLGITSGALPSSPGAALLGSSVAAAEREISALFPTEVDRVYIQHDLSIIAPGPLVTPLDLRLRVLADIEARGLASTYRVTGASLVRAMTSGESAAGIRAFLADISLTGIPQPLDYLLGDTAARFGSLRVGPIDDTPRTGPEAGARSYVRSDDHTLLAQLDVDQNLAPVGLRGGTSGRRVSRFDPEIVYWNLADARYPVVAEDAEGRILPMRRERRGPVVRVAPPDPASALVARLREATVGGAEETGQAWLVRQLEHSIRSKVAVTVTVRLPDGTDADYLLEPASLGGGRLRARDRRADIERTLPLASITAVRPA